MPCFVFGQLFPDLPGVLGKVAKITEQQMGKEIRNNRFPESIFKPKINSGWKYTYIFDENSRLIEKICSSLKNIETDYLYSRKTIDDRLIVRETNTVAQNENVDDYVEYENFLNKQGQPIKVNFWAFNATKKTWEIFQAEQNAEYQNGRLTAFTRYQVNDSGDFSSGEKFTIKYNFIGEIVEIERKDLSSGFRTEMKFSYNNQGGIEKSAIDFLTDIQEYNRSQLQEVLYKCDRKGNWTRKYVKAGEEFVLSAKRKIKYL